MLGFNVAVAVVTGVVCGLAYLPAATKVDLATVFSGSAAPHVTSRTTMRRALLSLELAVTFVLVVGAALLVQTLWNLNQSVGFDADRVLTMRVAPTAQINRLDFRSNQTFLATFFTDLAERLGTLQGVVSAAAVTAVPFSPPGAGMGRMAVEGHPDRGQEGSLVPFAAVTPGYFRVMRIALTAGRDFTNDDGLGAQQVAIRWFQSCGGKSGPSIRTS